MNERDQAITAMNENLEREADPVGKTPKQSDITVRPMRESDLAEAKRIFHLAFGTFLGLPDPMQFVPDRDFVTKRWRTDPTSAFTAESNGQVIGSNIATTWGSIGFFGPLTIRPDFWGRGVANRLLEATMDFFEQANTASVGLFTFPNSTKHIHLYQKFGFLPRFLTPLMSLAVRPTKAAPGSQAYSELSEEQRREVLNASYELTDSVHDGLDLRREIQTVFDQGLGDTVLLWEGSRLAGFAVCHHGPDTEGGAGTAYVKFAASRNPTAFSDLLTACEGFAASRGLTRIEAGVNMSRHDAYRRMMAHGFRTELTGVAMHKDNDPGINRGDVYIIDDWR